MIVEYNRKKDSEFGLKTGSVPSGVPTLAGNFKTVGASQNVSLLPKINNVGPFKAAVKFLPQDWSLSLHANLAKDRGKILSMPKITTLNGHPAHLRVRQTSYYPVTSFNQQGLPSTDFRSIDDGITIDLTPWVTQHGDVNLEIKPSIKTAQPTTNANSPAPVTDRAIKTNVRLRDGETLILGGLINSKESHNREYVPFLGQIPLLGYFFSWRKKVQSTTELVIYVTPHILDEEIEGVNLEEELKELDNRSGFIQDKDFVKSKSKHKAKKVAPEAEKTDSIVKPDSHQAE